MRRKSAAVLKLASGASPPLPPPPPRHRRHEHRHGADGQYVMGRCLRIRERGQKQPQGFDRREPVGQFQ